MKKITSLFFCASLTFIISCGSGGDADDDEDTLYSDPPVVQLLLQMDADTGAFLGALKGATPFQNYLSELAFDPDGSDLVSYAWSFSDGTSSTEEEPTTIFSTEGAYVSTLTVTDDEGETCDASMTTVVESDDNDASAVMIEADELVGSATTTFTFRAITDDDEGDTLTYSWDLGDATTATDRVVQHVYNEIGQFKPAVTVTDSEGNSSTAHICVLTRLLEEDPYYFNISCDPNPAEFFHTETDATIDLEVTYGDGTPETWSVLRGLPNAPTDNEVWNNGHSLSLSDIVVEDDPPRITWFYIDVEARGTNRVEVETCVVWVYHYCNTAMLPAGGLPPSVDLEDGSKVTFTPLGTAYIGGTFEMALRAEDANGIPRDDGEIILTLADPDDPSNLAGGEQTELLMLNLVGARSVSIDVPAGWNAGTTTLWGTIGDETFELGDVVVE